jgi:Holliday junction resolvase
MNRQKTAGDSAERELVAELQFRLGVGKRMKGAGRPDDHGDIAAVPDTTVQVTRVLRDSYIRGRIATKLGQLEEQRERAGNRRSVLMLRLGGGGWRAILPDCEAPQTPCGELVITRPPELLTVAQIVRWAPAFAAATRITIPAPAWVLDLDHWCYHWRETA